jgi:hypothetical protein
MTRREELLLIEQVSVPIENLASSLGQFLCPPLVNFLLAIVVNPAAHILLLRSIILFANTDVSRHILVINTSILMKSNMDRREYSTCHRSLHYKLQIHNDIYAR